MTETGGQGLLLSQIAGGRIDRGFAEVLLAHICQGRPGFQSDLSPGVREAFLKAVEAMSGDGATRERIALHHLGALSFDEADRYYDKLIEGDPGRAADLLRRKGGLFGVVNADVAGIAYTRLLELRPDDDRGRLSFAALLGSNGRFAEAADAYRTIILRSPDLRAIQEATARLDSVVLLLRLQPLSRWAHAASVMLLPKVLESLPWLAPEVERDGPFVWDFYASVATVYWVVENIRNDEAIRPAGVSGETIADLATTFGCIPPDRSNGLPSGVTAERARVFDERWSEAAAGALGDCTAFLGVNTEKRISRTGQWILGAFGASDVEFDDIWLVGDAVSILAREFMKPLE